MSALEKFVLWVLAIAVFAISIVLILPHLRKTDDGQPVKTIKEWRFVVPEKDREKLGDPHFEGTIKLREVPDK